MMTLIFKVLSAILTLFLVIILYGAISWNVFGATTFLSGGKECLSTVTASDSAQNVKQVIQDESEKQAGSVLRESSLFGTQCNTK